MNAIDLKTFPVAPNHYSTCYACDAAATGCAERWVEGKRFFAVACKRHANPGLTNRTAPCRYCGGATRPGSVNVGDGMYAHHKCYAEAERADRV